jgi:hypothetical protein
VQPTMTQTAPYPHELAEIVSKLRYKHGFRFELGPHTDDGGAEFLAFQIVAFTDDSINEGMTRGTRHLFIVPPATYNRANWIRWCYERVLDVERHEAAEFFRLDDERVFPPLHGNGNDPYFQWHVTTPAEVRKSPGED